MNLKSPESKQKNTTATTIIVIVIAVIAICGGLIASVLHSANKVSQPDIWHRYSNPENTQALYTQNDKYKASDKFEIDIIYQPSCKDCQQIKPWLTKNLKKETTSTNIMMVNAENKQIRKAVLKTNIKQTPTFVVKHHGYIYYEYSGTNTKTIKSLLNLKHPKSNQKFNKETPMMTYVEDGFHNELSQQTPMILNYR